MKVFFEDLFSYNELVNKKIIEVLVQHENDIADRIISLMSHIILVHRSWTNRMQGKSGLNNFWQKIPLENLLSENDKLFTISMEIVKEINLNDSFNYTNSKGVEFSNTFQDVLFHLINHSTYHRGQINALLRSSNIEPVIADYIFYKR